MKLDLRTALQRDILIGDGAMGTYLYQMGFPVGISYEELNLLRPETVADVHRRYFEAGARLIETNTFSANREKLSKYGLEGDVEAINRAGVELARKAVGDEAYVVGAIGSIRAGKRKNVRTTDVEESLREQIGILLDSPVDGLLLETFYDLEELQLALRIIRSMSELPVICQFANEGTGSTQDGVPLQEAFLRLRDEGADVIGFNCRVGPNGILRSMEKLTPIAGIPFSAFPNAGLPDYVDGHYTYAATPQYFAESALRFADLGARIIGGCCGTTPEHIAAVAKALQGYVPAAPGTMASARTCARERARTGEACAAGGQTFAARNREAAQNRHCRAGSPAGSRHREIYAGVEGPAGCACRRHYDGRQFTGRDAHEQSGPRLPRAGALKRASADPYRVPRPQHDWDAVPSDGSSRAGH